MKLFRSRTAPAVFLFILLFLAGCAAEKLNLVFTSSGQGAGIQSASIISTGFNAATPLSSVVNNLAALPVILEFTLKENGSRDSYPTEITELRINYTGPADLTDIRFFISGPGVKNEVGIQSGNTVVFSNFGNLIVNDGDTVGKVYQIRGGVRSSVNGSLKDNESFSISFDPNTQVTVSELSSNLLPAQAVMTSTTVTIQVTATELRGATTFTLTSATAGVDFPGDQSIFATDANGRVDLDSTVAITLAARNSLCLAAAVGTLSSTDAGGLTKNAVAGVATWNNLVHSQTENIRILATAGGLTQHCTQIINVN